MGYISNLISVRLHIDRPLMCMSIFLSLFPKVAGNVPKHNGLYNGYSLQFIKKQTNTQNNKDVNIKFKNRSRAIRTS